jgi:leucyl aminopeptidase
MPIAITAANEVRPDVDVVAAPVFADFDMSAGDLDLGYCRERGFSGKAGETLVIRGAKGATIVVLGLGDPAKLTGEVLRVAAAGFVRAAWRNRAGVFTLPELGGSVSPLEAARAVAEGAILAGHIFEGYKGSSEPCVLESLAVRAPGVDEAVLAAGVRRGSVVAGAVLLARDLVNEPAGAMTPRRLAEVATQVAGDVGLGVEVWDEVRIGAEGLGGLAGVAAGSDEPARLIRLTYEPSGTGLKVPTVALVGKGITFDSGGLSLKSAEGMMTMKTDMSGAAAVLGAMSVLRDLDIGVRVIGIMPTTENMPGGGATKPGDVLRTRNGKTIEVLNTDAEGRLVLADGLALAAESSPSAVVDLATLTGACVAALGRRIAGVMGNNEELIAQVGAAAERSGEKTWPLPLPPEYRKQVDSEIADMKNIGEPGQAGALVAGLILAEFVGDVPWAHLDIAGPARSYEEEGYLHKGGTGFGVRTLIELLSTFEPVR